MMLLIINIIYFCAAAFFLFVLFQGSKLMAEKNALFVEKERTESETIVWEQAKSAFNSSFLIRRKTLIVHFSIGLGINLLCMIIKALL